MVTTNKNTPPPHHHQHRLFLLEIMIKQVEQFYRIFRKRQMKILLQIVTTGCHTYKNQFFHRSATFHASLNTNQGDQYSSSYHNNPIP